MREKMTAEWLQNKAAWEPEVTMMKMSGFLIADEEQSEQ